MEHQERMFSESTLDPAIAQVADRYVELTKEKNQLKERLEAQTRNLIGMMKKGDLRVITHAGVSIQIVVKPGFETLKLTEEGSQSKQTRRRGGKASEISSAAKASRK